MQQFDELYTGLSNADQTFGNEAPDEAQVEAINQQQVELQALLPGVQHIIDVCEAEIAAVSDIRAYMKTLGSRPTKAQVEAEFAARELYIAFLDNLKNGIASRVADAERIVND